jgi:hypothetical protein
MDGLTEKIQQRAYSIFKERGNKQGNAFDDWIRAEKEVLANSRQDSQDRGGFRKSK